MMRLRFFTDPAMVAVYGAAIVLRSMYLFLGSQGTISYQIATTGPGGLNGIWSICMCVMGYGLLYRRSETTQIARPMLLVNLWLSIWPFLIDLSLGWGTTPWIELILTSLSLVIDFACYRALAFSRDVAEPVVNGPRA